MAHTTIALAPEVKDQLKEFGIKGETYEDIIKRLLQSARERQLHDFLLDTTSCLTLEEARARLRTK